MNFIPHFIHNVLLSNLLELPKNISAELASFFAQLLLHFKEVPVSPNTRQKIVEEIVKVLAQAVSNKYNMVTQSYFVLGKIFVYLRMNFSLSMLDIF